MLSADEEGDGKLGDIVIFPGRIGTWTSVSCARFGSESTNLFVLCVREL
jgi:hypothetical protein